MNNPAGFKCEGRGCVKVTDNWRRDGWVHSSGETIQGNKILHDHRSAVGHYCSWDCFCKQPVQDL